MIALVGGSGFYEFDGIESPEEIDVDTPFGKPSDTIVRAQLHGVPFLFLPRHGRGHRYAPSEINYRANIWALKSLGAREILSVSATGSLRENLKPGDLVLPDQYFDWTKGKRESTFFGNGLVAHVSTARPVCSSFTDGIETAAKLMGVNIHRGGTYACVEGPRLGTRAESLFLRGAGCDLVGMTNLPEAFLAREARLCYVSVCIVTDYDCWLDDPAHHADVGKILALYAKNLAALKSLASSVVASHIVASDHVDGTPCMCSPSVRMSIMNPYDRLSEDKRSLVDFLDA